MIKDIQPSLFFIIDSILPVIIFLVILLFDSFFRERNRNTYIFLLFYIAIILGYYISIIFSTLLPWFVFLGEITFLMIIYTFLFPSLYYFRQYKYTSQNIGMYLGYIVSVAIVISILFGTISLFYSIILVFSLVYQFTIYKIFRNYISYIIFLLTCIFLYLRIFLLLESPSFIIFLFFIFILPYIFIGISYFLYTKFTKEIYIFHFLAIIFSITTIVYYFISIGSIYDILTISILTFFESILIFISYVGLKK